MTPHLARGAAAGVVGSIVQAMVGKAEELSVVPPGETSDLAPRLMARLAARRGAALTAGQRWALGTAYHVGYGMWWGVLYASARERRELHPAPGGALLGGLIYAITFPPWGGAVQLGAERQPAERSKQMETVLAAVTLSFGLATA